MKRIGLIVFVCILLSGCNDITADTVPETNPTQNIDIDKDEETSPDATHSPAPKISSDFHDAPTTAMIREETGLEVAEVLLQDTLTYDIQFGEHFAVALEEDASKQYRWLLASDDDKFKYVEEVHINGYRVFVFDTVELGKSSLLFELTQNTTTLVETLSYQLNFIM